MFILSDIILVVSMLQREGKKRKTVTVFEDYDDAERYAGQLKVEDYKDELEIIECDVDVVAINCDKFGYTYLTIKKDDLLSHLNDYI